MVEIEKSYLLSISSLDNCIRQEEGYCRIQWDQSASTSPDPFQMDTQTAAASAIAAGGVYAVTPAASPCLLSYVIIPDGSDNGIAPLNSVLSGLAFQNNWCGADLGYTGTTATPSAITCKSAVEMII